MFESGLSSVKLRWAAATVMLVAGLAVFFLWGRHPAVLNLGNRAGPVVFLGDSITAGLGATQPGGFVEVLAARTGEKLINRGRSGDTTAHGLARLRTDVLDLHPALVVVELGGNDFLNRADPQEIAGNLDRIVAEIQAGGAAVLLLGMQSSVFTDRYASIYRDLARSRQTAYVPNIMRGIFDDPTLKADPIHPNDAGYVKMADVVEPELRWCLSRLKR